MSLGRCPTRYRTRNQTSLRPCRDSPARRQGWAAHPGRARTAVPAAHRADTSKTQPAARPGPCSSRVRRIAASRAPLGKESTSAAEICLPSRSQRAPQRPGGGCQIRQLPTKYDGIAPGCRKWPSALSVIPRCIPHSKRLGASRVMPRQPDFEVFVRARSRRVVRWPRSWRPGKQ